MQEPRQDTGPAPVSPHARKAGYPRVWLSPTMVRTLVRLRAAGAPARLDADTMAALVDRGLLGEQEGAGAPCRLTLRGQRTADTVAARTDALAPWLESGSGLRVFAVPTG